VRCSKGNRSSGIRINIKYITFLMPFAGGWAQELKIAKPEGNNPCKLSGLDKWEYFERGIWGCLFKELSAEDIKQCAQISVLVALKSVHISKSQV
jgi:hypothetical protein